MQIIKVGVLIFTISVVFSCSSNSKPVKHVGKPLPTACKQMTPIKDIWVLEPMLAKKNLIKTSMTKTEKAKVIRDYIRNKNEQYKICSKNNQ